MSPRKCFYCDLDALDGHLTCGRVQCSESQARVEQLPHSPDHLDFLRMAERLKAETEKSLAIPASVMAGEFSQASNAVLRVGAAQKNAADPMSAAESSLNSPIEKHSAPASADLQPSAEAGDPGSSFPCPRPVKPRPGVPFNPNPEAK